MSAEGLSAHKAMKDGRSKRQTKQTGTANRMKKMGYRRLDDFKLGNFVFLLCWVAYFTSYIGRYNYSAAMADIVETGAIPISKVGLIGTAYFFCYGAGQIVTGFLGDRFSPFILVFAGLLTSAAANGLMFCFPSYGPMSVIWAVNGLAQSMIWSPILRIFAEILPREQQNKACINITSTVALGTLASYGLSMVMMSLFSWRAVFSGACVTLAAVAFLWAAGSKKILAAAPRQEQSAVHAGAKESPSPRKTGGALFPLLAASGVAALVFPVAVHGILKDGMTSWVPTFISESFDTTPAISVLFTMVLPVVNLVGAYAADFINRRVTHNEVNACALLFAVATLALCGIAFLGRLSVVVTVACLAVVTSSMLGINTLFINVIPVLLGKNGKTSSISGLLNSIAYLGCAFSTWGIGFTVEHSGWGLTTFLWVLLGAGAVLFCLLAAGRWKRYLMRANTDETHPARA